MATKIGIGDNGGDYSPGNSLQASNLIKKILDSDFFVDLKTRVIGGLIFDTTDPKIAALDLTEALTHLIEDLISSVN
jgi:hypothetical protein